MITPVRQPHASTVEEVARALDSDLERGLLASVASQRLERHGPNRPKAVRRPEYLRLVLDQVLDPLVALLVAATVVSVLIGDTVEAAAIAAVLVLNAALGFWHELAAERAVIALSEAFTQSAIVMRDGIERKIPAEEVVPGDLLVVRAGERVAADARIVEARSLEVDESALTGESLPVSKQLDPVGQEAPLAERLSMLYAGTGLTRGHCRALVCATGTATELGQIEALTAAAKPPPTPLERRLTRLTQQMVVAGILLTVALTGVMVLQGEPLHSAFLVGVAVAVAAVPEGLAATVTAALALGARSLAGRGAIVRRLDAITTLGETTVICTDKTGTLTENEMRVAALRPADGVDELRLLEAAALASEAKAMGDGWIGDPVEAALMLAAMERGIAPVELLDRLAHVHEIPFDSDRKRMTVVYDRPDCSSDDGLRHHRARRAHVGVWDSIPLPRRLAITSQRLARLEHPRCRPLRGSLDLPPSRARALRNRQPFRGSGCAGCRTRRASAHRDRGHEGTRTTPLHTIACLTAERNDISAGRSPCMTHALAVPVRLPPSTPCLVAARGVEEATHCADVHEVVAIAHPIVWPGSTRLSALDPLPQRGCSGHGL